MKKLKFFSFALLSILIFSLSGCKSDDDETTVPLAVGISSTIYFNGEVSGSLSETIMMDYYNVINGKTFYSADDVISATSSVYNSHKTTYSGKGITGTVILYNYPNTSDVIKTYTYNF